MVAGASSPRTSVASSSTASAIPTPSAFTITISAEAKAALTRMTMAAALVMMPPLRSSPSATLSVLSPVCSCASRMRESRKTS